MTAVAVVICLLLEAGLGYGLWRAAIHLRRRQGQLLRARHQLAESRRIVQARIDLEAGLQRVEDTVDWTTASVEAIHRAVSDLSFDLAGQEEDGHARTVHDRASKQVYTSIREVNRGVGGLLSGLLDERRRDRDD